MRIKIGNKIYDGSDKPIMVIFDRDGDKENLQEALNIPEWQGKYSRYTKSYFKTVEEEIKWMDDIGVETEGKFPLHNLIEYN